VRTATIKDSKPNAIINNEATDARDHSDATPPPENRTPINARAIAPAFTFHSPVFIPPLAQLRLHGPHIGALNLSSGKINID
jgi:hypothetical protein